jgi:hypothetical protein
MFRTRHPREESVVEFVAGRISPQAASASSRWQRRLRETPDVEALVSLVRDYTESLAPEHFARLPEDCRPGPINTKTTSISGPTGSGSGIAPRTTSPSTEACCTSFSTSSSKP